MTKRLKSLGLEAVYNKFKETSIHYATQERNEHLHKHNSVPKTINSEETHRRLKSLIIMQMRCIGGEK